MLKYIEFHQRRLNLENMLMLTVLYNMQKLCKMQTGCACSGRVAQLLGASSVQQNIAGLIPGQGTYGRQPIISLSY